MKRARIPIAILFIALMCFFGYRVLDSMDQQRKLAQHQIDIEETKRKADEAIMVQQRQDAQRNRDCIQYVLAQNASISFLASDSQRAEQMKSIDMSQCSQDIRGAYTDYIHAWEDLADAKSKLADHDKDEPADALRALVSNTLVGDPSPAYSRHVDKRSELKDAVDKALDNLRKTRQAWESKATYYGISPQPAHP